MIFLCFNSYTIFLINQYLSFDFPKNINIFKWILLGLACTKIQEQNITS